jgi:hypothetical protein
MICRHAIVRDKFIHTQGGDMPVKTHRNFLRYVLWADAISCLVCGVLQVALTGPVSSYFGLSQKLLMGTGVFLLLYGAVVAFLATRTQVPSGIIGLLIVGNVVWGALAVAVLMAGHARIALLGKGYVTAQALTVLILAQLQYLGVRLRPSTLLPRGESPGTQAKRG